jgi:hypothetical protein
MRGPRFGVYLPKARAHEFSSGKLSQPDFMGSL